MLGATRMPAELVMNTMIRPIKISNDERIRLNYDNSYSTMWFEIVCNHGNIITFDPICYEEFPRSYMTEVYTQYGVYPTFEGITIRTEPVWYLLDFRKSLPEV